MSWGLAYKAVTSTFIKPNFKMSPWLSVLGILPSGDHEEQETRDPNTAKTYRQHMRNKCTEKSSK